MASGYATLANDGVFREPTCIKSIKLSSGEELDYSPTECRVYSENSAREITDVLCGVPKRGTARGLTVCDGMPIACKTGTTNKQTNGWFCGYTPYYTVSCYVGFDQAKSVSDLWGSTYPMDIWKGIQDFLCKNKEILKFKKPEKPKPENTKNPESEAEPEVWSEPVLTSEPTVADTPEPSEYPDDNSSGYLEPDDSYDGEDYYNMDDDYKQEEPEELEPGELEPEEPKPEKSEPEEPKPDESEPEEPKPDESEPEESSSEAREPVDDGDESSGDGNEGNVVIDEEE